MTFPLSKIVPLCAEFGVDLTDEQLSGLNTYGEALLEWNEKMNLTAITDPEEVVIKHFYDCILVFKNIQIPQNAKVIDVGTGAGFPGMVLKIIRPDIQLTLLDGLNKRLIFLNDVLSRLKLTADTVHMRAEEGGKNKTLREKFDFAFARAVARQNILAEYCLPFCKVGGTFVAMKGPAAEEEIKESLNAIKLLGGEKSELICEKLPSGIERSFIITKKISQTPPKYPRIMPKITKQPL